MRIAFDLDGVLADLHGPFVQKVKELFPRLTRGPSEPPMSGRRRPTRIRRKRWRMCRRTGQSAAIDAPSVACGLAGAGGDG